MITPTDIKTEPSEVQPVTTQSVSINNEIKKNETKEESRKKELQEELKSLNTDNYNPNDILCLPRLQIFSNVSQIQDS